MNDTVDLAEGLKVDSVLRDARFNPRFIYTEDNRQRLVDNGILHPNQSWAEYRQIIYRLLLHPNREVMSVVNEQLARMEGTHTIGVHIRTGGLLADDCERVSFVNQTVLETIPDRIDILRRRLTNDTVPVSVYVSSDSTKVIRYITEHLNRDYTVYSLIRFKRGHTTNVFLSQEKAKAALADLFVLAACESVLTTHGSGFSSLVNQLSQAEVRDSLRIARSVVQCPKVDSTVC